MMNDRYYDWGLDKHCVSPHGLHEVGSHVPQIARSLNLPMNEIARILKISGSIGSVHEHLCASYAI